MYIYIYKRWQIKRIMHLGKTILHKLNVFSIKDILRSFF